MASGFFLAARGDRLDNPWQVAVALAMGVDGGRCDAPLNTPCSAPN
jgi:hypothetical protein